MKLSPIEMNKTVNTMKMGGGWRGVRGGGEGVEGREYVCLSCYMLSMTHTSCVKSVVGVSSSLLGTVGWIVLYSHGSALAYSIDVHVRMCHTHTSMCYLFS